MIKRIVGANVFNKDLKLFANEDALYQLYLSTEEVEEQFGISKSDLQDTALELNSREGVTNHIVAIEQSKPIDNVTIKHFVNATNTYVISLNVLIECLLTSNLEKGYKARNEVSRIYNNLLIGKAEEHYSKR